MVKEERWQQGWLRSYVSVMRVGTFLWGATFASLVCLLLRWHWHGVPKPSRELPGAPLFVCNIPLFGVHMPPLPLLRCVLAPI